MTNLQNIYKYIQKEDKVRVLLSKAHLYDLHKESLDRTIEQLDKVINNITWDSLNTLEEQMIYLKLLEKRYDIACSRKDEQNKDKLKNLIIELNKGN